MLGPPSSWRTTTKRARYHGSRTTRQLIEYKAPRCSQCYNAVSVARSTYTRARRLVLSTLQNHHTQSRTTWMLTATSSWTWSGQDTEQTIQWSWIRHSTPCNTLQEITP